MTEAKARAHHDIVVTKVRFDETARTIIDGRTDGFCKLIVDRATQEVLGCHVVGERAVEIVQVVTIAMAAGMTVELGPSAAVVPHLHGAVGMAARRSCGGWARSGRSASRIN